MTSLPTKLWVFATEASDSISQPESCRLRIPRVRGENSACQPRTTIRRFVNEQRSSENGMARLDVAYICVHFGQAVFVMVRPQRMLGLCCTSITICCRAFRPIGPYCTSLRTPVWKAEGSRNARTLCRLLSAPLTVQDVPLPGLPIQVVKNGGRLSQCLPQARFCILPAF